MLLQYWKLGGSVRTKRYFCKQIFTIFSSAFLCTHSYQFIFILNANSIFARYELQIIFPSFTSDPWEPKYSWQRDPSAQVGPPSFQSPVGGPLCAPVQVEKCCVFTWQFNLQSRARTFRGWNRPLSWSKRTEKSGHNIHDRIFDHHCSLRLSDFSIIIEREIFWVNDFTLAILCY